MKQLNVFCEGQTEQGFCVQVLQPHLFPSGDGIVHTLAVGEKDHHHIYGLGRRTKYAKVKKFITNTLKQRAGPDVYFTSLFDLYALPSDFPGKDCHKRNPSHPDRYVTALEDAFGKDINCRHFIPYLQLYEYETMLFANPGAFCIAFEHCEERVRALEAIVNSVPTIEHINDGMESAPSKRIIGVVPEYEGRKSTAGPDIAALIGLKLIREKCAHVHLWLDNLEKTIWGLH